MARILSHPFRLELNGTVATVEQDTATADAEQIAVLALTRLTERPLVPGFGITDPAYRGLDPAELRGGLAVYGPPVTVTGITARPLTELEELVEVSFD